LEGGGKGTIVKWGGNKWEWIFKEKERQKIEGKYKTTQFES
jgi:hypothetical protein